MKTRVTFSGGFHNSGFVNLDMNFSNEALCDYADGNISAKTLIDENLTPYQRKRLERHFCGIKGCTCGHRHAWPQPCEVSNECENFDDLTAEDIDPRNYFEAVA